jgi:hypothetical protein
LQNHAFCLVAQWQQKLRGYGTKNMALKNMSGLLVPISIVYITHDFGHRFMGRHQTTFWLLLLQAGMLARFSPQVKARAETRAFWQVFPGLKVIHRGASFLCGVLITCSSSQHRRIRNRRCQNA